VTIEGVLGRLAVTAILGGIATYASKQSSLHRRLENRSRRLELELTVFPPFIEGLDPVVKTTLRTDFVGRLFKGADAPDEGSPDDVAITADQVSLFGHMVDVFQKAITK
jgi:hypothetical protein